MKYRHVSDVLWMRPVVPLTVSSSASARRESASRTDITAGRPISRAVTAPCDNGPPHSVITADALKKSGLQAGFVVRATRTAPCGKRPKSSLPRTRNTGPLAVPGLPGRPERTLSLASAAAVDPCALELLAAGLAKSPSSHGGETLRCCR